MPGIDYTISAHDAGLHEGMHAATEAMEKMHEKVKESVIHFLEFAGVAVTVKENIKMLGEAFEMGGKLEMLSMRTGASVEELALLTQAFKTSGMGAEAVGPAINKMQKALTGVNEEGQGTAKAFDFLHLNMESINKMGTLKQFEAISEAISNLESPAKRSAAAMGIFGRAGAELLPLFLNKGAMGMAKDTLGNQAEILGKNAEEFHKVTALMESMGTKIQGIFVNAAAHIAKPLELVFDKLNKTSAFEHVGDTIGRTLEWIFANVASGAWLETLSIGLMRVFKGAVDLLIAGQNLFMSGVGKVFGFEAWKIPDLSAKPIEDMVKIRDMKVNNQIEKWKLEKEHEHEHGAHEDMPDPPSAQVSTAIQAAHSAGHQMVDRLTQIGFNMGGHDQDHAVLQVAEKTAANTHKSNSLLEKILVMQSSGMVTVF